jgi:hypothetical protein
MVQAAVERAKPTRWNIDDQKCWLWLRDSDRAAMAFCAAFKGKEEEALSLAEPLAEKYAAEFREGELIPHAADVVDTIPPDDLDTER